jgi:hypothetical protein
VRWQYRLTFSEGNTGTCIRDERQYDSLNHFRERFSPDRILQVEERYGAGEWVASELLPTSKEEADAMANDPVEYPPMTDIERKEIEDWFDGTEE